MKTNGKWTLNMRETTALPLYIYTNKTTSFNMPRSYLTSYISPISPYEHTQNFLQLKREMAFMISKAENSFSNSDKASLNHSEEKDNITRQLYLRSSSTSRDSSSSTTTEVLDRKVVLKRIRHHKSLNKVKSAFQALVSSSESGQHEHRWLDDAFSSPWIKLLFSRPKLLKVHLIN